MTAAWFERTSLQIWIQSDSQSRLWRDAAKPTTEEEMIKNMSRIKIKRSY